jgi:hypothetical protein
MAASIFNGPMVGKVSKSAVTAAVAVAVAVAAAVPSQLPLLPPPIPAPPLPFASRPPRRC